MDKPESRKANRGNLFQPGQSGNPGGRAKVNKRVREMARAHTEEAVQALVDALKATKAFYAGNDSGLVESPDHATRIHAAQALLDRGWGKPIAEDVVTKLDADELDAGEDLSKLTAQELADMALEMARALPGVKA